MSRKLLTERHSACGDAGTSVETRVLSCRVPGYCDDHLVQHQSVHAARGNGQSQLSAVGYTAIIPEKKCTALIHLAGHSYRSQFDTIVPPQGYCMLISNPNRRSILETCRARGMLTFPRRKVIELVADSKPAARQDTNLKIRSMLAHGPIGMAVE